MRTKEKRLQTPRPTMAAVDLVTAQSGLSISRSRESIRALRALSRPPRPADGRSPSAITNKKRRTKPRTWEQSHAQAEREPSARNQNVLQKQGSGNSVLLGAAQERPTGPPGARSGAKTSQVVGPCPNDRKEKTSHRIPKLMWTRPQLAARRWSDNAWPEIRCRLMYGFLMRRGHSS